MDHISKPKKNFTTRRYDFRLAQHKLDNAHLLVSQTGDRTRTFPRHSFLDERMRDGGRCREKATSKKPRREVAAAAARGSHLDRERKAAGPRSQRSSKFRSRGPHTAERGPHTSAPPLPPPATRKSQWPRTGSQTEECYGHSSGVLTIVATRSCFMESVWRTSA